MTSQSSCSSVSGIDASDFLIDVDDGVLDRVCREHVREANLYAREDGNYASALHHLSQAARYSNGDQRLGIINDLIGQYRQQQVGSAAHEGINQSISRDNLVFRRATLDDTAALVAFGRSGFSRQFSHLYPREQLEAFLSDGYTHEAYKQWITSGDYDVFICIRGVEDSIIVGYALLGKCGLPHPQVDPLFCREIKRLYVDRNYFGAGVGAKLMDMSLAALRERMQFSPKGRIWLGVYSDNFRAQKFYKKYCFRKVGEYLYEVGECRDLEYILRLD